MVHAIVPWLIEKKDYETAADIIKRKKGEYDSKDLIKKIDTLQRQVVDIQNNAKINRLYLQNQTITPTKEGIWVELSFKTLREHDFLSTAQFRFVIVKGKGEFLLFKSPDPFPPVGFKLNISGLASSPGCSEKEVNININDMKPIPVIKVTLALTDNAIVQVYANHEDLGMLKVNPENYGNHDFPRP